ncbi:Uncharacterised protein [Vibrio cholerae]|nr:Uncharacterised protein [Vibrio cholerae]CSC52482.1 Uncharacterised protein [Vibrio cholerae]CSC65465.1 Uncharacterised protein [Vibrio cholerae]CSC66325.1 Uncharacterised protein [Vibrio cholerae]
MRFKHFQLGSLLGHLALRFEQLFFLFKILDMTDHFDLVELFAGGKALTDVFCELQQRMDIALARGLRRAVHLHLGGDACQR